VQCIGADLDGASGAAAPSTFIVCTNKVAVENASNTFTINSYERKTMQICAEVMMNEEQFRSPFAV